MFGMAKKILGLGIKKQMDFEMFILKSFDFASFERKILESRG